MRNWQPIHHERWSGFLAGLAARLRGERPPVEPPVPVAPLQAFIAPPPVQAELLAEAVMLAAAPRRTEPLAAAAAIPAPPPQGAEIAATAPLTAHAFFAALSWSHGKSRLAAAVAATAPALAPAPLPQVAATRAKTPAFTVAATAGPFFRTLPWDARRAPGETLRSIRVTATRDDAGLDPRTAELPADNLLLTGMLSAARTAERVARLAAPATTARTYFHDLPWSAPRYAA